MKLSNLWSILVAVMLSLCLATVTSCCDDDDDSKKETESIVGTWYYVDPYYSASEYYVKIVFKENGTGTEYYYEDGKLGETERFEWEYDERSKELAIFYIGYTDDSLYLTVKSISSSKLVLYDPEDRETYTFTSTRP